MVNFQNLSTLNQKPKTFNIMATYYNENTVLYLNGAYVKSADAKMDLYGQSLHYGYSVFEGIRSYKTSNSDTKIFKARRHFERLHDSATAINLPYHWTVEELIIATYEILERNNLQDAYIRPVVFAPCKYEFRTKYGILYYYPGMGNATFFGRKIIKGNDLLPFKDPTPGV
jgi:branched-chain amino acid aminotransferase